MGNLLYLGTQLCTRNGGAMLHKVPGEVGQPGIPSRGKVRSEKDHSPLIQEARMVRAGTTGR